MSTSSAVSIHPRASARRARALRTAAALGVSTASGFAGLGLQIVWVQQASTWLGHEAAAVLAVVAAFFGGLALGALVLAPRLARWLAPAHAYAACELVIAVWAVVLALGLGPTSEALLQLIGARPTPLWQGTVAFAGCFVLLLPATAAMGATLPAMADVLVGITRRVAPLPALYACNTGGAVFGSLVAALWLVPEFGLMRSSAACAALAAGCAVAALVLAGPVKQAASGTPAAGSRALLATLAATGLLGIGYEVVVVRVLSQVTEDTVYTYALLLAVYLVGTALGAAAHGVLGVRWRARLLPLQASACLVGCALLWSADDVRTAVQAALGGGMPSALAAETLLALLAFALPTFVMGALFAEFASRAQAAGHDFALALGVNTLGAALAPLVFGVGLAPALGPKGALLSVALGYAALALAQREARAGAFALVLAVLVTATLTPPLAFVDLPPGGRLLSYSEGALAAVSVVEDSQGTATLRINNRQQEGSSSSLVADARQAMLPLLLHRAPARALFLGLGTGVTAAWAAADPQLQVDAVELLPEVAGATGRFVSPSDMQRLNLTLADARRYVRTAQERYDVIVADNVHPARSGTGALLTVEHFAAVKARLAPGGLYCQWLPLHQLDTQTLRVITRSFIEVYPDAWAILATHSLDTPVIGLVARRDDDRFDHRFDLAALNRRMAAAAWPRPLADFGLHDELSLAGSFIAGPAALHELASGAPANTDDRPVVAYRAPRVTYAPDTAPRERLMKLLQSVHVAPGEVVGDAAGAPWKQRLAAYWKARDLFIAAGQRVRPTANPRQMLQHIGPSLLEALQASPDFRPAYDPLLRLAVALGAQDRAGALDLLATLDRLAPARPEAEQARSALQAATR